MPVGARPLETARDQATAGTPPCQPEGLRAVPEHQREFGREVGDRGETAERHGVEVAECGSEAWVVGVEVGSVRGCSVGPCGSSQVRTD